MRKIGFALLMVIALVVGPLSAAGSAAPPPKRAELVPKPPTASYAAGMVTVSTSVKNKGTKKAKKSQTAFFLSADATKSANDATLGAVATKGLKPKARKGVSGALALPVGLQPGTYRVIACADATGVVKERKEQNNCKTSKTGVTVPGGPPPAGKVTVSATATTGGTVAASAVSGGSCTGTFCTLASGAGAVTFTPTTAAGNRFGGWSGCTGYTGTTAITFTNPTASKDCVATFVKQVTISWSINSLIGPLGGSVSGAASHGTCTGSEPVTGAGSCLVDAGVGTVTLTAAAVLPFKGWTCPALSMANPLILTSPTTDVACTASFNLP